jgi:hypothetical protein
MEVAHFFLGEQPRPALLLSDVPAGTSCELLHKASLQLWPATPLWFACYALLWSLAGRGRPVRVYS